MSDINYKSVIYWQQYTEQTNCTLATACKNAKFVVEFLTITLLQIHFLIGQYKIHICLSFYLVW